MKVVSRIKDKFKDICFKSRTSLRRVLAVAGLFLVSLPWISRSGLGPVEGLTHFPIVLFALSIFLGYVGFLLISEVFYTLEEWKAVAEQGWSLVGLASKLAVLSLGVGFGAAATGAGFLMVIFAVIPSDRYSVDLCLASAGVFLSVTSIWLGQWNAYLRSESRRLTVSLSNQENARAFVEQSSEAARDFYQKALSWSGGDKGCSIAAASQYLKAMAQRGDLADTLGGAVAFLGETLCREVGASWQLKPRRPPVIRLSEDMDFGEFDPLDAVCDVANDKTDSFERILKFIQEEEQARLGANKKKWFL